jgi:hypothetical protein
MQVLPCDPLRPSSSHSHYRLAALRGLGFAFFEFFARLNGKLWREGRATLQEIARALDRAMEAWTALQPLWSG